MCGIVGVIGFNALKVQEAASYLMLESEIRGKHATGVSFYKDGILHTIKEPVPISEFNIPQLGNVMIGHVRYSTSDIEFNQPLTEGEYSIVHNGVITQAPFEQWETLFGFKDFATRNDSEILLKAWQKNMFCNFPNSSIALGVLINGEIFCKRNEQRPLYIFHNDEIQGFASTEDIIKRALGNTVKIFKTEPNVIYNLRIKNHKLDSISVQSDEHIKKPDLQYNLPITNKYVK